MLSSGSRVAGALKQRIGSPAGPPMLIIRMRNHSLDCRTCSLMPTTTRAVTDRPVIHSMVYALEGSMIHS